MQNTESPEKIDTGSDPIAEQTSDVGCEVSVETSEKRLGTRHVE
jgi:hypothetical protein